MPPFLRNKNSRCNAQVRNRDDAAFSRQATLCASSSPAAFQIAMPLIYSLVNHVDQPCMKRQNMWTCPLRVSAARGDNNASSNPPLPSSD